MAEYIEREAATKALCNSVPHSCDFDDCERLCPGVAALDSIPSADVRPVVRCKDCRHRDPEDHKCDCGQLERAGCVFPVDDNYFCAYGERKGEP